MAYTVERRAEMLVVFQVTGKPKAKKPRSLGRKVAFEVITSFIVVINFLISVNIYIMKTHKQRSHRPAVARRIYGYADGY